MLTGLAPSSGLPPQAPHPLRAGLMLMGDLEGTKQIPEGWHPSVDLQKHCAPVKSMMDYFFFLIKSIKFGMHHWICLVLRLSFSDLFPVPLVSPLFWPRKCRG